MRLHFSLRRLLLAFTTLSVAFYIAFIRPTVLANRFVAALESGDYRELALLTHHGSTMETRLASITPQLPYSTDNFKVAASISPRTWQDVWRFRRRVDVEFTSREEATPVRFVWSARATVETSPIHLRVSQLLSPPVLTSPEL